MSIITLTSDWGHRDHYLASVKGAIISQYPEAKIIDISHDIEPFNILQASFIIKNAFNSFPKNSIHLICMNTEASIETPHTLVKYHDQYFIGTDNGIFSLIFDEEPETIIELEVLQDSDYFTFSSRDVFAKVAALIAQGRDILELGNKKTKLKQSLHFKPVIEGDIIKGKVVYIDGYENLITNISNQLFKEIGKSRKFNISFRAPGYTLNSVSTSYSDVAEGEMLALFNTMGLLEIAINKGNAGSLLGMNTDDIMVLEFVK